MAGEFDNFMRNLNTLTAYPQNVAKGVIGGIARRIGRDVVDNVNIETPRDSVRSGFIPTQQPLPQPQPAMIPQRNAPLTPQPRIAQRPRLDDREITTRAKHQITRGEFQKSFGEFQKEQEQAKQARARQPQKSTFQQIVETPGLGLVRTPPPPKTTARPAPGASLFQQGRQQALQAQRPVSTSQAHATQVLNQIQMLRNLRGEIKPLKKLSGSQKFGATSDRELKNRLLSREVGRTEAWLERASGGNERIKRQIIADAQSRFSRQQFRTRAFARQDIADVRTTKAFERQDIENRARDFAEAEFTRTGKFPTLTPEQLATPEGKAVSRYVGPLRRARAKEERVIGRKAQAKQIATEKAQAKRVRNIDTEILDLKQENIGWGAKTEGASKVLTKQLKHSITINEERIDKLKTERESLKKKVLISQPDLGEIEEIPKIGKTPVQLDGVGTLPETEAQKIPVITPEKKQVFKRKPTEFDQLKYSDFASENTNLYISSTGVLISEADALKLPPSQRTGLSIQQAVSSGITGYSYAARIKADKNYKSIDDVSVGEVLDYASSNTAQNEIETMYDNAKPELNPYFDDTENAKKIGLAGNMSAKFYMGIGDIGTSIMRGIHGFLGGDVRDKTTIYNLMTNAIEEADNILPRGEGFLEKGLLGASRAAPGFIASAALTSLTGGLLGPAAGVTGAVRTGLFSKELAMGLLGPKLAHGMGPFVFWWLEGSGSMMKKLTDNGVDPSIAKYASALGAVPYAAIEFMQVKGLLPGKAGKGINRAVTNRFAKLIMDALGKKGAKTISGKLLGTGLRYGANVITESVEEGVQEGVQEFTNEFAKIFNDEAKGTNLSKGINFGEIIQTMFDVVKESVPTMSILGIAGIPGNFKQTVQGKGVSSTQGQDILNEEAIPHEEKGVKDNTLDQLRAEAINNDSLVLGKLREAGVDGAEGFSVEQRENMGMVFDLQEALQTRFSDEEITIQKILGKDETLEGLANRPLKEQLLFLRNRETALGTELTDKEVALEEQAEAEGEVQIDLEAPVAEEAVPAVEPIMPTEKAEVERAEEIRREAEKAGVEKRIEGEAERRVRVRVRDIEKGKPEVTKEVRETIGKRKILPEQQTVFDAFTEARDKLKKAKKETTISDKLKVEDFEITEPKGNAKLLENIFKKLFNVDTVFFKGESSIGGFQKDNKIFININRAKENTIPITIGHEFSHWLSVNNNKLFNKFKKSITESLTKEGVEAKTEVEKTYKELTKKTDEEFVASVMGEAIGNPEFLAELSKNIKDKTILQEVYQSIIEFIDKIIVNVKKSKAIGASKLIKDMNAFRSQVAKELAQFGEQVAKREIVEKKTTDFDTMLELVSDETVTTKEVEDIINALPNTDKVADARFMDKNGQLKSFTKEVAHFTVLKGEKNLENALDSGYIRIRPQFGGMITSIDIRKQPTLKQIDGLKKLADQTDSIFYDLSNTRTGESDTSTLLGAKKGLRLITDINNFFKVDKVEIIKSQFADFMFELKGKITEKEEAKIVKDINKVFDKAISLNERQAIINQVKEGFKELQEKLLLEAKEKRAKAVKKVVLGAKKKLALTRMQIHQKYREKALTVKAMRQTLVDYGRHKGIDSWLTTKVKEMKIPQGALKDSNKLFDRMNKLFNEIDIKAEAVKKSALLETAQKIVKDIKTKLLDPKKAKALRMSNDAKDELTDILNQFTVLSKKKRVSIKDVVSKIEGIKENILSIEDKKILIDAMNKQGKTSILDIQVIMGKVKKHLLNDFINKAKEKIGTEAEKEKIEEAHKRFESEHKLFLATLENIDISMWSDKARQRVNEALFAKPLDEMTSDQLEGFIANIEHIKETGRTIFQQKILDELIEMEQNVKGAVGELEAVHENKRKSPLQKQSFKDKIAKFKWIQIRIERVFEYYTGLRKSTLKSKTFNVINKASERKMVNVDESNKRLDKIYKQLGKTEKLSKTIGINVDLVFVDEKTGEKTVINQDLTIADMMSVYGLSQNELGKRHLEGTGFTIDTIKEINEKLDKKYRFLVDSVMDYLAEYEYSRMNEVFYNEFGINLPRQDNYFPISFVDTDTITNDVIKDISARFGGKAFVFTPAVKERTGSEKALTNLDFFTIIGKHVSSVEHYIAYSDAIRKVNRFLSQNKIRGAMANINKNALFEVDEWLKATARGRLGEDKTVYDRLIRVLRQNYVVAVLGAAFTTIIKQPVSFIQGMGRIKAEYVGQTLKEFIVNPKRMFDRVNSLSIMMKHRGQNLERVLAEETEREFRSGRFGAKTLSKKLKKATLEGIRSTDKLTTVLLWDAKYKEIINENIDNDNLTGEQLDKLAIEEADELIRKTQPMGGLIHLARIHRASGFISLFTLFTNQINQNLNMDLEMKRRLKEYGGAQITKEAIFNYIFAPLVLSMVINGFRLRWEEPEELLKTLITSRTGGIPVFNKVVESMLIALNNYVKEARGESIKPSFMSDYILDLTPPPLSGVKGFIKAIARRKPLDILTEAGKVAGVPATAAIKKFVKGLPTAIEKKDPRYVLFSRYAIEGKKKKGLKKVSFSRKLGSKL